VRAKTVKLSPTGGVGAASTTVTIGTRPCVLRAVHVQATGQGSGTTDVTVSSLGREVAVFSNLGDGNSTQQPLVLASAAESGADLSAAGDEARLAPILHGTVSIVAVNADPQADGVVVTLFTEDEN
jgi:hypothetical protein